ncbi:MAG: transglycosylase SLT domain-containing protein [Bacteroidales bacterium]|nr:transglycosylase SLT domain-containing protein [Bacteroidales bacterium]
MFIRKWLLVLIFALLAFAIASQFFIFSKINTKTSNTDEKYFKLSKQTIKIFQPYIPDTLSFCGEPVPINNILIRERLERELISNMYRHSSSILILKRSGRYFPIIEPILKENNVHNDIKFLAMCESELANVTSPAGADGFWQFLKGTAIEHNLEVSRQVNERRNLEKSTVAACNYIKHSLKKFGSYTLAAAAYNTGNLNLQNKIDEQHTNDYYSLSLNEETSRYVFRILALKLIYNSPLTYGFFLRNKDIYQPIPTKEFIIDSSIDDLAKWAKEKNSSLFELRYFNPWLTTNSLTVIYPKTYKILLPLNTNWKASIDKLENPSTIFNDSIKVE